ncbi:MAG: carboxypeptidase-like regulatory domain-containing protein, partial [Polyangiaceae bacterium]
RSSLWLALGGACLALSAGVIWLMTRGHAPADAVVATPSAEASAMAARGSGWSSTRTSAAVSRTEALPNGDIVGVVRAASGHPLRDALVCTRSQADCCSAPSCSATDERGHFALYDVPAEHRIIVASAPEHLAREQRLPPPSVGLRSLDITLLAGGAEVLGSVVDATGGAVPGALVTLRGTGAAATTTIVIAAEDGRFRARVPEGEVDVVARADAYSAAAQRIRAPARQITLVLAPGAEIVGRVVDDASDEPVAGVTLSARSPHATEPLPHFGVSGADGEFRLSGLQGGGWYRIDAASQRWRSDERWISVDVGQSSEPLLLRLRPATTLAGTVRRAGEPCVDALVTASGPSAQAAYSSESGQVRLEGLWPGRYQINVYCDAALPYREAIEIEARDVVREWDVDLGFAVLGKVQGPRGEPVANAVVSVVPVGESEDRSPSSCISAEDGEFTCSGLSVGEHDCFLADTADAELVRVSLGASAPAEHVLLRARAAGTIQVSVSSPGGDSGEHKVFARGSDGFALEGAPRQGGAVFERVPLGRYEVYADLPLAGASPVVVELERSEQVVDVEVRAARPISIEGRAVDEQGAPVIEAWVGVSPSDTTLRAPSATYPPALTDDEGAFTIPGLTPGEFTVQVRTATGEGERRGIAAGSTGVLVRVPDQAALAARR